MKRALIFLLAALSLASGRALAAGLPEDVPLIFGAYGDDAGATALPQGEFDAALPRPGEAPPASADSFPVSMSAQLIFPCAAAPGLANLQNDAGSGKNLRYRVEIAVSELERVAGTDGGATGDVVVLCQTGAIPPGYALKYLTLLPLLDGKALPQGEYAVAVVVQAFDATTNAIATADVRLETTLSVLADEREMELDAMGEGRFSVYNGLDEPASYRLVMSQQAAYEATGDARCVDCEQPEYAFLTLYEEEIPAYGRADAAVRVAVLENALPAGTHEAWLVRYRESSPDAPEVVGRVRLLQH